MEEKQEYTRIPFRSPKHLKEEDINAAFTGTAPKHEASHIGHAWIKHYDDKEIIKLVMNTVQAQQQQGSFTPLYSLIVYCLQAGFDLHAALGDAGPASLYAQEEKAREQKEEEEQAIAEANFRKSFGQVGAQLDQKGAN